MTCLAAMMGIVQPDVLRFELFFLGIEDNVDYPYSTLLNVCLIAMPLRSPQ